MQSQFLQLPVLTASRTDQQNANLPTNALLCENCATRGSLNSTCIITFS